MLRARGLRREATVAERLLWRALRNRGIGVKVRRQVPVGPYFLDFLIVAAGLVVEIDGETHATEEGVRHDAERDAWLIGQGLRIVRFSNREVLENLEGVITKIVEFVS